MIHHELPIDDVLKIQRKTPRRCRGDQGGRFAFHQTTFTLCRNPRRNTRTATGLFIVQSQHRAAMAAKDFAASGDLQDQALLGLLASPPGEQGSPGGVFKYLPHALVCLRGALEVLLGTDLLTNILGLWVLLVS